MVFAFMDDVPSAVYWGRSSIGGTSRDCCIRRGNGPDPDISIFTKSNNGFVVPVSFSRFIFWQGLAVRCLHREMKFYLFYFRNVQLWTT